MNMSNITFEVHRLSKCSEKLYSGLNIVIRAERVLVEIMLAKRCISIGPMYRVIWCFWRRDRKRHPQNKVQSVNVFQCRARVENCGSTLKQHWVNATFVQCIQQTK